MTSVLHFGSNSVSVAKNVFALSQKIKTLYTSLLTRNLRLTADSVECRVFLISGAIGGIDGRDKLNELDWVNRQMLHVK